jgi:molecular chaperone GrpE
LPVLILRPPFRAAKKFKYNHKNNKDIQEKSVTPKNKQEERADETPGMGKHEVKIEITADDEEQAEESPAAGEPSEEDETEDIDTVKQEGKENYDKYLRVCAEFDNYKKRAAREISDFRKYANETLLKELLSVIDNLERAVESTQDAKDASDSVVEGVEMTLKEILKIAERYGVKPLKALDEPFDPNFHQAMMQEASDAHPENTVLKELQKGYLLHDRLLRPSMVVVSSAGKKDN